MTDPPPTVTITQAMKIAQVCRRTIYNWMRDGKVQFVRTAGGSRRIIEASLWKRPSDPSAV